MKLSILSPHRDDAAFSCSYLILAALRAGIEVTIVNIFTRTRYAPFWTDAPPDAGEREISAHRLTEDVAFISSIADLAGTGNVPRLVDLDRLDAPIRLGLEDDDVAGADFPPGEVDDLAAVLAGLPDQTLLLVPLALGGHVDHRLARAAAERAAASGRWQADVGYYEDMPYAAYLPAHFRDTLFIPENCQTMDLSIPDPAGVRRKMARLYRSQIPAREADRMEDHSRTLDYKERLYIPANAAEPLSKL